MIIYSYLKNERRNLCVINKIGDISISPIIFSSNLIKYAIRISTEKDLLDIYNTETEAIEVAMLIIESMLRNHKEFLLPEKGAVK